MVVKVVDSDPFSTHCIISNQHNNIIYTYEPGPNTKEIEMGTSTMGLELLT